MPDLDTTEKPALIEVRDLLH